MTSFKPRTPKWLWRDFVTAREAQTLAEVETAKAKYRRLVKERSSIMHAAIARAKAAGVKKVNPSNV